MELPQDISEVPKWLLAVVGAVLLLFLLFMVDRFAYPLLPRPSPIVEKLTPPPGYPDIPPYNTKAWQERFKKQGGPMGAPGGPGAPPPGPPGPARM